MTNKEIISGLHRILAAHNEIRKDEAAVNTIEEAIERIGMIEDVAKGLKKWLEETAPDKIAK